MSAPLPPHVAAAAKIVDEWLRTQPPIPGAGPPPSTMSAADRYRLAQRSDAPVPQPAWKNPRGD